MGDVLRKYSRDKLCLPAVRADCLYRYILILFP